MKTLKKWVRDRGKKGLSRTVCILTPAQGIRVTDKQFNYNDIIYFS